MNSPTIAINKTLDEIDSLPLPTLGDQPSKQQKCDDLEIDRLAKAIQAGLRAAARSRCYRVGG